MRLYLNSAINGQQVHMQENKNWGSLKLTPQILCVLFAAHTALPNLSWDAAFNGFHLLPARDAVCEHRLLLDVDPHEHQPRQRRREQGLRTVHIEQKRKRFLKNQQFVFCFCF